MEISNLPPHERTRRYREMASDAEQHARNASGPFVREAYEVMAEQWRRLADETDRQSAAR